jgi:DNA end-binding protein Ku
MAQKLIEQLSADEFRPEQYKDEYRGRLQEVVQQKVEGKEVTTAEPEQPRAQVIDLMEALKASLSRREGRAGTRPVATAEPEAEGKRRPAATAQRRAGQAPKRRAAKK